MVNLSHNYETKLIPYSLLRKYCVSTSETSFLIDKYPKISKKYKYQHHVNHH